MSRQLLRRAYRLLVRLCVDIRRRSPHGIVAMGHHNRNHIKEIGVPLALLLKVWPASVWVKFRTPLENSIKVVPRIWPREPDVLRAVNPRVPDSPRCLVDLGNCSVGTYVPGRVLSRKVPVGGTYGSERLEQVGEFFAALASVPKDDLPPLPDDWPKDGECHAFLAWLARFVADEVYRVNLPVFGTLFEALGVPEADAVQRFVAALPPLVSRPFILLHTDVTRDNIVVLRRRGDDRLVVIDWESAMYGDPLHDLATHIVRMGYGRTEKKAMIRHWEKAMRRSGHPEAATGLEQDLTAYLAFEHAQSVYPDVMRAALALPDRPAERDFLRAARRVRRAVRRAREALGLEGQPVSTVTAVAALRQWHGSRVRAELVCGHGNGAPGRGDWWKEGSRSGKPGGGSLTGAAGTISLLAWAAAMAW